MYDAYLCLGWIYVLLERYDDALKIVDTALAFAKKDDKIDDFDKIVIQNISVIKAALYNLLEEYDKSYDFFKKEKIT